MRSLFSIFSTFSAAVFAMISVPFLIDFYGAEQYATVALFNLIMALASVLDTSLSQVLMRESSKVQSKVISVKDLSDILKIIFMIFLTIYGVLVFLIYFFETFFNFRFFPEFFMNNTSAAVKVVFIFIIYNRLTSGLLRGVLIGLGKIHSVSLLNIAISFARFLLAVYLMKKFSWDMLDFFLWQFFISVIELGINIILSHRFLTQLGGDRFEKKWIKNNDNFREIIKRILQLMIPALIWVIVTQSDKAILSHYIEAKRFSYFSAAFMITTIILLANSGLVTVITPTLSSFNDRNEKTRLIYYYNNSTAIIAILSSLITFILVLNAHTILLLWTSNRELADYGAIIVKFYAFGTMCMVLAGIPYGLQFAMQKLSLHLKGNLMFIVIYLPLLILVVPNYFAYGAGLLWVFLNAGWLMVWCGVVHRNMIPNMHLEWMIRYICIPMLPNVAFSVVLYVIIFPIVNSLVLELLYSIIVLTLSSTVAFRYMQNLKLSDL